MSYFDWSATTNIDSDTLKIYEETAMKYYANPSSSHNAGKEAAYKLDECRNTVAEILHTEKDNIYFTSGGTESNSIILNSLLLSPSTCEIITTAIEHPAILEYRSFFASKGYRFTALNCKDGYLDVEKLKSSLNPNVKMVCIMAVNNITGTVQNLKSAVNAVREYSKETGRKIHIHCDAVQAAGKMEFYPEELDIDSASFSAHKFYGPRGIGILYNRNKSILPLSKAGGQEKGLRPGTENLAAISAMTYVLKKETNSLNQNYAYVSNLRSIIEKSLINNGFSLISPSENSNSIYSPYILCVSAEGIPSEVFLRVMDEKGFYLSSSSACSSNSKAKAESILSAMNVSPEKRMSAIRISLSHKNSIEETNSLIKAMIETKKELSYGKH